MKSILSVGSLASIALLDSYITRYNMIESLAGLATVDRAASSSRRRSRALLAVTCAASLNHKLPINGEVGQVGVSSDG